MHRIITILALAACLSLAACGPERTPEQEQARRQIIKYCQLLPSHSPERCECIVDRLEDEMEDEEFQELSRAAGGFDSMEQPGDLFHAMGDMVDALSGAGSELNRVFQEAERTCPQ